MSQPCMHMYLPGPGVIESCEGPGDEIRVGHHHRVVGVRGQPTLAQVIHQLKSDRNVPELTYRGQNQGIRIGNQEDESEINRLA